MTIQEAIRQRRSIRCYKAQPIAPEAVAALRQRIADINHQAGLHFQLVTNEPHAFTGLLSYGQFSGVTAYIVCAARRSPSMGYEVGYHGERLVLEAQTMGLATCWVGLTFRKTASAFTLGEGEKVYCVIAIGYGDEAGRQHKIKAVEQVSNATSESPVWFRRGVKSALLAPTAVNQQKFAFELLPAEGGEKPRVAARKRFSIVGYTAIDLGIAAYHFEVGAGSDNFTWA